MKYAKGGNVHALARKYAIGGEVGLGGDAEREPTTENPPITLSMGYDTPPPPTRAMTATAAPVTASAATQPVMPRASGTTPVSPAAMDLMSMLRRYEGETPYSPELREARQRAAQETQGFDRLLAQMANRPRTEPDKAELYFRLAAAFGAPTKFGSFGESLGVVGREMGAYQQEQRKAQREDEALRRQLALEAAKMRVGAAREDVTSLRGLAAEEIKDRRALLTEYMKSGRGQSEAGKAADDMGLKEGTPERAQFVREFYERKFAFDQARMDALRLGMDVSQANLGIAEAGARLREEVERRRAAEAAKLPAPLIKLKTETEDSLASLRGSLQDLGRAFELNELSFDNTAQDKALRMSLQQSKSKDPRLAATQDLETLLKSSMISNAAEKMKGVLSDSDIKLLLSVSGVDAKSRAERAAVIKQAYLAAKRGLEQQQRRLQEITSGRYGATNPAAEGAE